jgi:hypothetical protein
MIATSSSSNSTFLEADYSVLGQVLKTIGIDDNVVCTGSGTLGLAFSVLVGSQRRENTKVIDCRWGIGNGPGVVLSAGYFLIFWLSTTHRRTILYSLASHVLLLCACVDFLFWKRFKQTHDVSLLMVSRRHIS